MKDFEFDYLGNRVKVQVIDFDHKYGEVIWKVASVNGREVDEKFKMPINFLLGGLQEGLDAGGIAYKFLHDFTWKVGDKAKKAMQEREDSLW